jgi:hypothetical protein
MIFTETRLPGAFILDIRQHEFEAHSLDGVVAQASLGFSKRKRRFVPAASVAHVRAGVDYDLLTPD